VIEYGSGEVLKEAGLGARMEREGFVHTGVNSPPGRYYESTSNA
jgi:hypothetical protein